MTSGWRTDLAQAAGHVARFCGAIEGEFLSIGGQLQDFSGRAGSISASAEDVAALLGGERIVQSTGGLSRLAHDLESFFDAAGRDLAGIEQSMTRIVAGLHSVEAEVLGFERVVRLLRILGVSTRIESARLTRRDTGFDTLSADVTQLSVSIAGRLDAMVDRKNRLERRLAGAAVRLKDLEARRGAHAGAVLAETRQALGFLDETHQRSAAAAGEVARISAAVSGHVSDVVMSMQFHDITRQELEHVRDALNELAGELPRLDADAAAVRTAGVSALQAAQLDSSKTRIVEAVSTIADALRGTVHDIGDLARRAREVAGLVDQAGGSVLQRLEDRLKPAIERLFEEREASAELTEVLRSVAAESDAIAAFVGEIQQIGTQIERIAMNASVRAAHTGAEGAALGVLAEAIQRLSADTRQRTSLAAAALHEVLQAAEEIKRRVDQGRDQTHGMDAEAYGHRLEQLIAQLDQANAEVTGRVQDIERTVRSLSSDIEATVEACSVREHARGALDPALALLRATEEAARRLAPAGALLAFDAERAQARYTTVGERHVHHAVLGAGAVAGAGAAAAVAVADTGTGSELGDNVELF